MDKTIKIANAILIMVAVVGVIMLRSEPAVADGVIKHNGFPEESVVQSYVQHAWDISNGDMDFITTMEAENGLRNPQRQSEVWSDGIREDSRGFCQLHRAWHSAIVDDPRFFTDPYRQLEKCYEKFIGGTTFYGYFVRGGLETRFTFDGTFVQQQHLTITQSIPTTTNTYLSARKAQDKSDESWKKAMEDKRIAEEKWKLCKETGDCVE